MAEPLRTWCTQLLRPTLDWESAVGGSTLPYLISQIKRLIVTAILNTKSRSSLREIKGLIQSPNGEEMGAQRPGDMPTVKP